MTTDTIPATPATCPHPRYEIVALYRQPARLGGAAAIRLRCCRCWTRHRVTPQEFARLRLRVINVWEWRRLLPQP